MGHKKYTSIESFANVFRGQRRFDRPASAFYGAKVKLHGTNAGVRIEADGSVHAQSRSRDIFIGDDNAGFAAWVDKTRDHWTAYMADVYADLQDDFDDVVVYGEWAGKGIQKNDAVTMLDHPFFFVFAVEVSGLVISDPEWIESLIPDLCQVVVVPWYSHDFINFADTAKCEKFAERAAERVEEIGGRDPFIYEMFEIDGPGEGLVYSPVDTVSRDMYSELVFKVKSEHHAVKQGKTASTKIEVPESVGEFVSMFVTPARLEQGFTEACGGVHDPKKTGDFLRWIGQDVHKESVAELEDMNLEWKDVAKHVTVAARDWYIDQSTRI